MTIWSIIGWTALSVLVWRVWPVWLGVLLHRRILDVPPELGPGDPPLVSIIVPARDEAEAIEAALRRLLALDYPRFEVIAIDDRSRDETGAIMDRIAAGDSRCRVIHLTELPPGWLGKNHANMLGASEARGDYLLFTDGDVLFEPTILQRAMRFMRERQLDHLVLFPRALALGFWESLLMTQFVILFGMLTRYSLVRFRWAKRAYVGVGAFNLMRREAYERIGTHERLRLEVADDLMLGKLVKVAGLRQDALDGSPLVSVQWQKGVTGIIRGLEKNAFAGVRYSAVLATLAILAQIFSATGPFVLAITGPARLPFAILSALLILTFVGVAVRSRYHAASVIFLPLGGLLFAWILARSTFVTLRDGGVTWRDTFYPLSELRRGMV